MQREDVGAPASRHERVTGPAGAAPTHSSLPTGSSCLLSAFLCESARAAFPKGHELHSLKTDVYPPAILEAGSLKSRCWRGRAPLEALGGALLCLLLASSGGQPSLVILALLDWNPL